MKPTASAMFFQRRGSKPRITVTANALVSLDTLKNCLKSWTADLVRSDDFGHCFTIHVAPIKDLRILLQQLRAKNSTNDQTAKAVEKHMQGTQQIEKIANAVDAINAMFSAHSWHCVH